MMNMEQKNSSIPNHGVIRLYFVFSQVRAVHITEVKCLVQQEADQCIAGKQVIITAISFRWKSTETKI